MDFKDKVCVVTGGANGIGLCIAEEFLAKGADVAVMDTDATAGDLLLQKYGEKMFFARGDVVVEKDIADFVGEVLRWRRSVDFLTNNACAGSGGILSGMSFEDFNRVLISKATAPYMLTKLFLPHFARDAAVVNIASTRAAQSQADTESYSAANGAMISLTHALSVSLAGKVRVNAISPGWIDTQNANWTDADKKQHPAGRIGKPEDIAKMAMYLCSKNAGFITGQNFTIDGGMSKLMTYHGDFGWSFEK